MGQNLIAADYAGMERAERAFRAAADALDEVLSRLDGEVRSHLAEWTGDARHAYQEAHDDWVQAARLMHASITLLHRQVGAVRDHLNAADMHTARHWPRR